MQIVSIKIIYAIGVLLDKLAVSAEKCREVRGERAQRTKKNATLGSRFFVSESDLYKRMKTFFISVYFSIA